MTTYFRKWSCDLPDAVHNGIVHSIGFGKERTPNCEKRADFSRLKDACEVDD